MKSMRTTFRIFAAAASAALGILTSCQQQGLDTPDVDGLTGKELVPVTLKASFVQTKVSYTETSAKNLKPVWEADDKVIGFDGNNNTYEFTVTDVDATSGAATLTGTAPANCTLHLIYLRGADKDDITSGSLSVNYKVQAGDNTIPAVMLADGKVTFGTGDFHFSNAGAVIGIDAVKGVPSGSTISKATVSGDNLSSATIAVSGEGKLIFTVGGSAKESISTVVPSGVTVDNAVGKLSKQVLIAIPAGAKIKNVTVETSIGKTYIYKLASPAILAANDYAYVEGKTFYEYVDLGDGLKWATCNLGASSPEEYGYYFAWGATEGFYPESTTFSHNFNWKNCPFNNGSSGYNSTYFEGHQSEFLNGMTLKPEYDAAHVMLGGGWRMPKSNELYALQTGDDITRAWTTDYNGTGIKGWIYTSKSDSRKSIFLPAAGYGSGTTLSQAGSSGTYWSSSLSSLYAGSAGFLVFDNSRTHTDLNFRYYGRSIRPIFD